VRQSECIEDRVAQEAWDLITRSPATAAAAGIATLMLPPVRAIILRMLRNFLLGESGARARRMLFPRVRPAREPRARRVRVTVSPPGERAMRPPLHAERPAYAPAEAVPTYPPPDREHPVFPPR